MGGSLFKDEFSEIYLLSTNSLGTIVEHFDLNGGGGWVPRLRRNLNDWEVEDLTRLLSRLDDSRLDGKKILEYLKGKAKGMLK